MYRHPTPANPVPTHKPVLRRRFRRPGKSRQLIYFIAAICLLATLVLLPGATLGRPRYPSTTLQSSIVKPLHADTDASQKEVPSPAKNHVFQSINPPPHPDGADVIDPAENADSVDSGKSEKGGPGVGANFDGGDDVVPAVNAEDSVGENEARNLSRSGFKAEEDLGATYSGTLNVSAIVLFHNEYDTLDHTLESWEKNRLYDHLSDILFFLNGVPSKERFMERLPRLRWAPWKDKVRVETSTENLKLGVAITKMVEMAHGDFVLLLEKDWALIENTSVVGEMLGAAARLLNEDIAQVVRFRHRDRPGAPLHARIMHEGREQQMLDQQKNLYCYLHHWVKDLPTAYPDYFTRCSHRKEDVETWCAKAKYCQWTNNPSMFKREWFLKELGDKYMDAYNKMAEENPNSQMLDFEFYTNWQHDVWNDRDFVVALPKGLFEHQEVGEQNLMNTVWYAWNRLNTDMEEKNRALLQSEVKDCSQEEKAMDSGPKWAEKFPIEFVRLYHYDKAMKRSVREAVEELQEEALRCRQVLEDGGGSWRNGVTDLTNLWYKVVLFQYPEEPEEMDIVFVTALYGDSEEPSEKELEVFSTNIGVLSDYRLVLFCTELTKSRLEKIFGDKVGAEDDVLSNLNFITNSASALLERLLGKENVERTGKLIGDEGWLIRAQRRGGAAPGIKRLQMNMAKPYMLKEAMTDEVGSHFVWVDGLSPCLSWMRASNISLNVNNDIALRANLLLAGFVTGVRATNSEELEASHGASGFSTEKLLSELEIVDQNLNQGVVMPDMKVMGGSRLAVTLMVGYYDVVLRDMLRKDSLGTGREALAIAYKNVNYNFRFFDSRDSCRPGDHCSAPALDNLYATNDSKSCALFRWLSGCVSDHST
eukprot:GFKZ01008120.1.p1 GENE.GFKZ01008120.1~~GFKZ01008120.1.p1  ORF type:complete len:930 (-),score=128.60 GFKZ01008120.1:1496-4123(-)